jgi:hypothetical protein
MVASRPHEQPKGTNGLTPHHLWRAAVVIVGVLVSTVGFLVERRLAAIEEQLSSLDHRVDGVTEVSRSNADFLKYLYKLEGYK